MNYQHTTTKEIKTYSEIKKDHRNISFPKAGAIMFSAKWKPIKSTDKPTYNDEISNAREIPPVNYTQTWEIYTLLNSEQEHIQKEKKKEKKNKEWKAYLRAKEEAEKQAWVNSGMPTYGG